VTPVYVLAAGGTGGHLFPAEAVARLLVASGGAVHLLTDQRADGFAASVPGVTIDLVRAGRLDFLAPDPERFPCLRHAREAARLGGLLCASLNAADEIAVQAFLDKRLNFGDIPAVIETVMARVQGGAMTGLAAVMAADEEARALASEAIARRGAGQSMRA